MHRERKNLRSTRKNTKTYTLEDDMCPAQEANASCNLFCFAALADTNENTIYTDLTGKFPVRSHKGHQYIFVAYIYDENTILIQGMPNRVAGTQVKVLQDIYKYLVDQNIKPILHVIDNECSKTFNEFIIGDKKTCI